MNTILINTTKLAAVSEVTSQAVVRAMDYNTGMATVEVPFTHEVQMGLALRDVESLSPIVDPSVYSFKGHLVPFKAQKLMAEFSSKRRRAFIFAEMGTGKTAGLTWAAEYLFTIGEVKRVLVIAGGLILRSAWLPTIAGIAPMRPVALLKGTKKQRIALLEEAQSGYVLTNPEALHHYSEEFLKQHFDAIIVDESTTFKNMKAKRWGTLNQMIKKDTYLWLATGTPSPQGPEDAYGQYALAMGKDVSMSEKEFINRVTRVEYSIPPNTTTKTGKYYKKGLVVRKPVDGWQTLVQQMLYPSLTIRKSECLDLPGVLPARTEYVELDKNVEEILKKLTKQGTVKLNVDGAVHVITAANSGALAVKIDQLVLGSIQTDEGLWLTFNDEGRIDRCVELIQQARSEAAFYYPDAGKQIGKSIVYVHYKKIAEHVRLGMEKRGLKVAVINSTTDLDERNRILKAFQETDEYDTIIASPKCFAHGVTATAASMIIWFNPITSTEIYLQANERTDRPGQICETTLIHLAATPMEEARYEDRIKQRDGQSDLLELCKAYQSNF